MKNNFIEEFIDYLEQEKDLKILEDKDRITLKQNISSYGIYRLFKFYSRPFTLDNKTILNSQEQIKFTKKANINKILSLMKFDFWMSNLLTQNIHNIEMKLIGSIIENLNETIWQDYSKSAFINNFVNDIKSILPKKNNNFPLLQFLLYHYDSNVLENKYVKRININTFNEIDIYGNISEEKINNINFSLNNTQFGTLNQMFFQLTKDIKNNILKNNFPKLEKLKISEETFEYILKCFNAFRNGVSHNNAMYITNYDTRFIKDYQCSKNKKNIKLLSWINIKNEIKIILNKKDETLNFMDIVDLMTYFDETTQNSKNTILNNLYILFHSSDETLFSDLKINSAKSIVRFFHDMEIHRVNKIIDIKTEDLTWDINEINWILNRIGTNWDQLKEVYRDHLKTIIKKEKTK